MLGNAPLRFRHSARKVLFPRLLDLAHSILTDTLENMKEFYILLSLLTLEFLATGTKDILILMVELEDFANSSQTELSARHSNGIHACIAGCLHIVSVISEDDNLKSYIEKVIDVRRKSFKHLLPEGALGEEEGEGGREGTGTGFKLADDDEEGEGEEGENGEKGKEEPTPYFNLIEKGFIPHPNEISRNSSKFKLQ